jgi:tetratricopeptide (TPR) repeat protein
VKAYPQAIQALNRSLARNPADLETLLALGRVFLEEGDLLAAREQFRRAAAAGPGDTRPPAWDTKIERKMGQPEAAVRRLTPLVRAFPRDTELRFELGSALMDQLRNAEAAREFEAMLEVDPLDRSAHFNLMLCRQRLNQLSVARREEVIYHLLPDEKAATLAPAPGQPTLVEDELLHIHTLEPRR